MLVSLARYHKSIAWFFVAVFYLELVLVPVAGRAESRSAVPYVATQPYVKSKHPWFLTQGGTSVPAFATGESAANARDEGGSRFPTTTHYSPLPVSDVPFTTGPGQPEMAAFTSVGSANMVDLFTGDFSYNIPLLDVGGYPVNLAYRAGVGMDDDASWVGLGWNINPGTITRNMRGLPDDFNGLYDSVRKVQHIKENKTVGVTAGADLEIVGFPTKDVGGQTVKDTVSTGINIGASLGVVHNNYRGWGLEHSINASINSGKLGSGSFTGGLSVTNSSMDGLSVTPSLAMKLTLADADQNSASTYSFSVAQPYNTRTGLRAMQLGLGTGRSKVMEKNDKVRGYHAGISSLISFNGPTYTPSITIPYTSYQVSFQGKVGHSEKVMFPDLFLSGYIAKQYIADADTLLELPSYGYLHYTAGAQNTASLLDFNREKELPYREKPAVPHIAIPAYTYDAFSITGEGTGGMFRAYRSDIGFVHDHTIRTKDRSGRLGVDIGLGDLFHAGLDFNLNRVITENGPWLNQNILRESTYFRKDSADFQAVYFRNPGEKSINDKQFYEKLGGDDVVTVGLSQPEGANSGMIFATNYLRSYRNGRFHRTDTLDKRNAVKQQRDKRTQVISYLTAREAQAVGLSKYIEYHKMNAFDSVSCVEPKMEELAATGTGLKAEYYPQRNFKGVPSPAIEPVDFWWTEKHPYTKSPNAPLPNTFPKDNFSIRWTGRLKAPRTGTYKIYTTSDDGMRVFLNDTLIINQWEIGERRDTVSVNLVAGKLYPIRVEYFEAGGSALGWMEWVIPGQSESDKKAIPTTFLYPPPAKDTFEHNNIVREQRVNRFRKATHISEIDVLNNDGRRYIYGIPVYNLKQKEVTFAVHKNNGDRSTGLVSYTPGQENTARNNDAGKDNYYSSEEVPAYAHSFLLTGILSADYSDITGNGISDDDIGDAVKFNYTKTAGIANPYQWRTPAAGNAAAYNEGLRTENRDDKGNYIFGEKELWYLHSIESKTMVATFMLEDRDDLPAYNEHGQRIANHATKRLKEIRLYSKSDFAAKRSDAIPVKTVHFKYSYRLCPGAYGAGTGKLTLDTVYFTYNKNDKGRQNPYVFNYNSKNPAYHLQRNDRWGTYKDPLQNPGSVTGNVVENAEYPYALQDSAVAAGNAAAWALDSIQLPSGGALKVDYESDDYAFVQNRRATQMFRVIGTAATPDFNKRSSTLYTKHVDNLWTDHRYVFIRVPKPVSSRQELYHAYLAGVEKLYFKLMVAMPEDDNGGGYEHVPVYADLDADSNYGIINSSVIWIKLAGISMAGDQPGPRSPLVKASTQFLRLNLPSKAYPGSETGDGLDLEDAVKMLAAMATNITTAFRSYDAIARNKPWGKNIDTLRSFVRLNNPFLKKMGGGHRVKRITVYDHWDKMAKKAGQPAVKPAIYGQEYTYTTSWQVDSNRVAGSSGVAIWEPGIGGEENPFRLPIEYVEKIAPLGPVTLGYSEEPLGESFFPGASVGYSCVRVRTINYKNRKSANGYEETRFYTAYDYPIYTDRTLIDGDNKKRYKPGLANLLRVNAKHFMNLSQGFKIELNDMHGKLRSQASYAETDPVHPISYSEQFYKTDTTIPGFRRLSNTVMVMRPDGRIDTAALIGKDVELMMDMRMQRTVTQAFNLPLNSDFFSVPFVPPVFLLPTLYNFSQREENLFRSAATTKIIQRYGILDSAIQVDKGSRISTQDLMYDSETGDVLLTRTQNEFNDPVFNFTYPSHWAYDGMGLAYKNIDAVLHRVDIRDGKLVGMTPAQDSLFSSGDEILVAGKERTQDIPGCETKDSIATFPDLYKVWAIDSSVLYGGARGIYFIDRWGKAYTGYDISLRIIRSGRRNILGAVGSITSLDSLVKRNTATGHYELVVNTNSKIIAASAGEFRQYWKTDDVLRKQPTITCIPNWQPDGVWECVQTGGVNTGYQRVQHKDINPNSPTYGDSTWVVMENCYACPRPGVWITTDSFQCAQDSAGNNLGFRYRGELDTASCSATYGQYRWQIAEAQNCTFCPKPARWQFTTGDSCQKDANGNNTGYLLRRQVNVETCNPTYGAYRWIRDTVNCMLCSKPDDWWALDSTRCEKDINGNNTGYLLRKEINRQGCSDSAYAVRWVRLPGMQCFVCDSTPVWQYTGGDSCQKVGNLLTGKRLKEVENIATCGDSAGIRLWVQYGADCDSCKRPTNWQYTGGDSCQKVGGVKTGKRLKEIQNIENCSDSAGMKLWVLYGADCDSCKLSPNWQFLRDSCVLDGNQQKTGIKLKGYQNTESCSDSFNVVKWVSDGLDCITCTTPAAWKKVDSFCRTTDPHKPDEYTGWQRFIYRDTSACASRPDSTVDVWNPAVCSPCNSSNCFGEDKKCINGICETGVRICVDSRFEFGQWTNMYYYEWSDGSTSDLFEVFQNYACTPGLPDPGWAALRSNDEHGKNALAQNKSNNKLTGMNDKGVKESKSDMFYRSVLPPEKYTLYLQKNRNVNPGNQQTSNL